MYIPDAFAETDTDRLHDLIEAHGFALLIGPGPNPGAAPPQLSHLPFVLDRSAGPFGTLQAHMARGNPHWQSFEQGGEACIVFQGPHAYISPNWYRAGQPAVPTWNYAVVHAWGTPRIVEDAAQLRAQQERLVAAYEGGAAKAWTMASQTDAYIDGMLKGIVGFEIPIARLEGKFKLSQNRKPEDAAGAIDGLRATGRNEDAALAELMARRQG